MIHQRTIRSTVRFLLDGTVHEVADADPTRTVLEYLREDLRRTGTKEGCAEGDCGACTVAVAEPDANGRLRVRAVNSCIQFLPTLDGKELLTVESLAAGGKLHPVQRAMVDCHGSQCGFCTPGFVMSLFTLFKTVAAPSRRDIDDALAGNLCRCTGYRPIIDAARQMYGEAGKDRTGGWLRQPAGSARGATADERERVATLGRLATPGRLALSRASRHFFAPEDLDDLAMLVGKYPGAVILAGGTDVGLWVTKELRELETVIYVGCVPELRAISVGDEAIEVGAAVSLTDAMPAIVAHYPQLEELFLRFASPPIRNAATLGGNIANGSPIGDSMPALMTLGTTLTLRRGRSVRELPLEAFYLAYRETALRPGEFLEKIRIPKLAAGVQVASYKVSKRFDQDISAVCGAFRLELDQGRVREARIAYGGMAAVPKRAAAAEAALDGGPWTEQSVRAAMGALDGDFEPISDMRASADYRLQVARNLLYRFYLETSNKDAAPRVYAYGR